MYFQNYDEEALAQLADAFQRIYSPTRAIFCCPSKEASPFHVERTAEMLDTAVMVVTKGS
jgi:hypothetical protein